MLIRKDAKAGSMETGEKNGGIVTDFPYGRNSHISKERSEFYFRAAQKMSEFLEMGSRACIVTDNMENLEYFKTFFDIDIILPQKVHKSLTRYFTRMIKNPDEHMVGPYVYGFSYKVGPDGKPSFQEFGNIPNRPSLSDKVSEPEVREPLTDINYDKDKVYLTFELPGISKENIDLLLTTILITSCQPLVDNYVLLTYI